MDTHLCHWRGLMLVALCTLLAGPEPLWAQQVSPADTPASGVLVLHNGQSLQGLIGHSGETWFVRLPEGEIRLRAADVDFACGSLQEAYTRQRAGIGPGSAGAHLRLAQWCLREGLLDAAGQELSDASAADPTQPMIELLRRRLEMARNPATQSQPGSARASEPSVSSDDLDRMVRSLPPTVVELFTQRIQPLLVNNCTAAGCHGAQSDSKFRLTRVPTDGPANRRLTQRNLHAVLQWVNRDNPEASAILTAPNKPHGTAKAPIFADQHLGSYLRLADWVNQVSNRPAESTTAEVPTLRTYPGTTTAPLGGQEMREQRSVPGPAPKPFGMPAGETAAAHPAKSHGSPTRRPTAPGGAVVPVSHNAPILGASEAAKTRAAGPMPSQGGNKPAGSDPRPSESPENEKSPGVQRGAKIPVFVPNDPFDPEIFNRRLSGQQGADRSGAEPAR